jgi:hypothetical protein
MKGYNMTKTYESFDFLDKVLFEMSDRRLYKFHHSDTLTNVRHFFVKKL